MTNKEKYKEFAQKEQLPIFMQPSWLESVCDNLMTWDAILYEKGGEIWGSFVYTIRKKYGFTLITMPNLTQFLGPYIRYPKGQKYYKKLSWEKEVMGYFIDNLPKFDYFNMNFHYSVTNWLPFYWRGFRQSTLYTYVIDRDIDVEEFPKLCETEGRRRRRRKAEKIGIEVKAYNDLNLLYRLTSKTFQRQSLAVPYSFEFLTKIYENNKQNIKIYVAKHQEKTIAANLLLIDGNNVFYLIGGIDDDFKDLGAMDLIQHKSIQYALTNNKHFDFEGSIIESIEKYFRSFGAVQKPYFNIQKNCSKILKSRECIRELLR